MTNSKSNLSIGPLLHMITKKEDSTSMDTKNGPKNSVGHQDQLCVMKDGEITSNKSNSPFLTPKILSTSNWIAISTKEPMTNPGVSATSEFTPLVNYPKRTKILKL